LKTVSFNGDIKAVREGEVVFGNVPMVRVEANLAEAQLIETALLNIVNYQTLIATKAARIKQVVNEQPLMEFGSRREHELDVTNWVTQEEVIVGYKVTSNDNTYKLLNIPVSGIHAHLMIQEYKDEYTPFKKYAKSHKDCVFLEDTY